MVSVLLSLVLLFLSLAIRPAVHWFRRFIGNSFFQNTYRPDGSFEGFEDYVTHGTRQDGDGLHGHFVFETDGEPHPQFVFETNKFARVDYMEGKRTSDHIHTTMTK